jgi:putative ABC transport system permease protein
MNPKNDGFGQKVVRSLGFAAQSFSIALEMLRMHKLRAALTMLGVIIGVFSVTVIVMASEAFNHYMSREIEKAGADTIIVMYDPGGMGRGRTVGGIEGLKNEDVQFLMDRVAAIDIASPLNQLPAQKVIREDRELSNPRIFASDHRFSDLNRVDLSEGRYLTEADIEQRANVCVIGEEIRDKLFPDKQAIGKFVSLRGITLEVIGVFKLVEIFGQNNGRDMLIPLSTAQDKWLGGDTVGMVTLRPKAGYSVNETMDLVWQALMIKSNNRRIYRVESRQSILDIFGSIITGAGGILAAIAALSLLVGGIGIMNIMLVSVTERTREIGLRKAVGARNGSILGQFLIESATLSLVGGLIGMGSAWIIGSMVTLLTMANNWPSEGGLPTPFPLDKALGAAAFSALIGMVFGLYPAISAAKLNPIDALRKE